MLDMDAMPPWCFDINPKPDMLDLTATLARVQAASTPTVAFYRDEAEELLTLAQSQPERRLPDCTNRLAMAVSLARTQFVQVPVVDLLQLIEYARDCAGGRQ